MRENEEGLSSLMTCTGFVAGSKNLWACSREHMGELGSQKGREVIVFPTVVIGVMQNVFNNFESGFRNGKTWKYKVTRKRTWSSNKRILLTFLHCFLTLIRHLSFLIINICLLGSW